MPSRNLQTYILKQKHAGVAIDTIAIALLSHGWKKEEISVAYTQMGMRTPRFTLPHKKHVTHRSRPTDTSLSSFYPYIHTTYPPHPERFYALFLVGCLLRLISLIPFLFFFMSVFLYALLLLIINSLVVLRTGKYWKASYTATLHMIELTTRMSMYLFGITDSYPVLSYTSPFVVKFPYPVRSNRVFAFPLLGGIGRLIMLLPFLVYVSIIFLAAILATSVGSLWVLFRGYYPESVYEVVHDYLRMHVASMVYICGLSDAYPLFRISLYHKGIKLCLLIIATLTLFFVSMAPLFIRSPSDMTVLLKKVPLLGGSSYEVSKESTPMPSFIDQSTWVTQKLLVATSSSEEVVITLKAPPTWHITRYPKSVLVKQETRRCNNYNLTSPNGSASLTISPLCIPWKPMYSALPIGGVSVGKARKGKTSYTLRFMDAQEKMYRFIDVDIKMHKALSIMDIARSTTLPQTFIPATSTFTYRGLDREMDRYLDIVDTIISSVHITSL